MKTRLQTTIYLNQSQLIVKIKLIIWIQINFGSVPASKQAFCEQQVFLEIVQKRGISALRTPGILARPPQRVSKPRLPTFFLFGLLRRLLIYQQNHTRATPRRGERLGRRWLNWLQVSWPDLVSTSKSQLDTVLYTLTSVCWALCIRCLIRFSWHDTAVEGSAYFNPWTIPFFWQRTFKWLREAIKL